MIDISLKIVKNKFPIFLIFLTNFFLFFWKIVPIPILGNAHVDIYKCYLLTYQTLKLNHKKWSYWVSKVINITGPGAHRITPQGKTKICIHRCFKDLSLAEKKIQKALIRKNLWVFLWNFCKKKSKISKTWNFQSDLRPSK